MHVKRGCAVRLVILTISLCHISGGNCLSGFQQLVTAIARDDVTSVVQFADSQLADDMNAWRNQSGWSYLHFASFHGAEKVASYLIEHGANLTAVNSNGETPLHLAAIKGHLQIIELITTAAQHDNAAGTKQMQEAAKQISTISRYLNEMDGAGFPTDSLSVSNTLKHLGTLRQATDTIERNIRVTNQKAKLTAVLEAEQHSGRTPIFYAVLGNSVDAIDEAVAKLMTLGANIMHFDKQGLLLLHIAVAENKLSAMDLLLKQNLSMLNIGIADSGKTVSHLAAEYNIADFPMDHFKSDNNDALGQNPACWAAVNGSLRFARVMLANDFAITNGNCTYGMMRRFGSPLHAAVFYRNLDYVKLLLDRGANATLRDSSGGTALHAMALRDSLDIEQDRQMVELLKTQRFGITELLDNTSKTPFLVAAESSSLKFAQHLHQAHGVQVDCVDSRGYSAVHLTTSIPFLNYLLHANHELQVEKRTRDATELTVLLAATQQKHPTEFLRNLINNQKANTEAVSNKGQNAVHIAVQENYTSGIQLFLEKKLDFSVTDKLGHSPLHLAIKLNRTEIAVIIIDHFTAERSAVLVQTVDDEAKNTPLHLAGELGNSAVMMKLLNNANVQVAMTNSKNQTALHLAVAYHHPAAVKFLLQKASKASIAIQDCYGRNVFHVAASSCSSSALEILKTVRDNFSVEVLDLLKVTDVHQRTPIDIAVEHNCPEMLQLLMNSYDNRTKRVERCLVKNKRAQTPIQHAAFLGYEYLVSAMIQREICKNASGLHMGLSMNCEDIFDIVKHDEVDALKQLNRTLLNTCLARENSFGLFPVHVASANNALRCLEFILQNMPFSVEKIDGTWKKWTPMHYAAERGHLMAVNILDAKRANFSAKSSSEDNEKFPVHLAASFGHLPVVKFILGNYPDMKTSKNSYGDYPIYIAALTNQKEVVEYFLTIGVGINVPDEGKFKRTCLHKAASKGHLDLVKWMISKGANVYAKSGPEDYEFLPVHLAAEFGHLPVVKFFIETYPDMKTSKNSEGYYPIHRAALTNQKEVVEYFLTIGVGINVPDEGKFKRICLHNAAAEGHLDLVKWLVSKGANVYAKSGPEDYEYLPVHLAAYFGHLPIVKFFIERYPDLVNAQNKNGWTPMQTTQLSKEPGALAVLNFLMTARS